MWEDQKVWYLGIEKLVYTRSGGAVFDTEITGSTLCQPIFICAGEGKHGLQMDATCGFTTITGMGI